jgi:hypothetical protein
LIWSTGRSPADISIGETIEDLGAAFSAPRARERDALCGD